MTEDLNKTMNSESVAISASALARTIAAALNEPNIPLIHRIITVVGPERTQAFLNSTLELEAQGGAMTSKEDRKRTPGGSFFYLVRKTVATSEHRQIWPPPRKKTGEGSEGVATVRPKPVALTWEQVSALVQQAKEAPGEAKTVKITLIGRPLKIIKQAECVILSMKGKEPGAFPKGLPTPPANSAITWAVFIANKQWEKVAASLDKQPEDKLIVEGYPLLKDGMAVVLAQSCKSVLLEQAARAQKTGG
ncbi:MAG: phosphorylated adapter RNA export RNA-binding domain-containing protein [Chloroflexi bacterium]|nr:phosphorylated adapter RNA export RNA-binding domain-containing protein [Chloroflexota bacterium]